MTAVRIVISGRVQGVSYRAWTVKTAGRMSISGWVRNRSDGTVEAVFNGEPDIIGAMIEACKKGPMMARVDGIESFAHDEPVESGFVARPTV